MNGDNVREGYCRGMNIICACPRLINITRSKEKDVMAPGKSGELSSSFNVRFYYLDRCVINGLGGETKVNYRWHFYFQPGGIVSCIKGYLITIINIHKK